MRIGIDCRTILNPLHGEKAGVGHYTYFLVKNLLKLDKKNQYFLFFDNRYHKTNEFKQKNSNIVYFPFSKYKKYLPFGYAHIFVAKILDRANLDIFHAPANIIPLNYKGKTVVTVHDLAIYRYPNFFPPGQKFSIKISVPQSLTKAERIIAISKSTKKDIHKLFKVPNDKISVIYEGCVKANKITSSFIDKTKKKFNVKDKYVLGLGTLEPRKNFISLIKAFDDLVCSNIKKYKDYQLILAGAKGWQYAPIFKAIKEAKCGRIRYLGYISEQEKEALLMKALCFVFPSFYEGFGLPVLEAMNFGLPVIASNNSSLPEVVGQNGLLVDPGKSTDIKKNLLKILKNTNSYNKFSRYSKKQAKKFSWVKCARQTLAIYQKVGKNNFSN